MKVRKRGRAHLYTSILQHGGMTIYRGERRLRGGFFNFGLRHMLPSGTIGKFLIKQGLKVAKKIGRRAAPKIIKTAIATGADLVSGKNVKKSLKRGLRDSAGMIASTSRDALLDELSRIKGHGSLRGRGHLMQTGQKSKIYPPSQYY